MNVSCYGYNNNAVFHADGQGEYCEEINSENPIAACCVKGDTCLANSICQYSHSLPGGSGYYAAGCSDPSFGAPCVELCGTSTDIPIVSFQARLLTKRHHIGHEAYPDVVFNSTLSLWQCCGNDANGIIQCQHPTDDTFNAPAPSLLSTIGPVQALSSSPPTPAITVIVTQFVTASTTTASTTNAAKTTLSAVPIQYGLHGGELNGVVIGSVVGVVLIAFAVFATICRRRARRKDAASNNGHSLKDYEKAQYGVELPSQPPRILVEADPDYFVHARELP